MDLSLKSNFLRNKRLNKKYMKAFTKETQSALTPTSALQILKDGNARFVKKLQASRDLLEQVSDTSGGQYPFAAILSCIDSRVPVEIVFDQGIGDIFSARVAGNISNEDILGSIEYACKVAGSKVVMVLGHSSCGAVTAACNGVELGNITALLSKIKPAVEKVTGGSGDTSTETVEKVVVANVELTIDKIRADSPILAEMEEAGEISIVGAVYSVQDGTVSYI